MTTTSNNYGQVKIVYTEEAGRRWAVRIQVKAPGGQWHDRDTVIADGGLLSGPSTSWEHAVHRAVTCAADSLWTLPESEGGEEPPSSTQA